MASRATSELRPVAPEFLALDGVSIRVGDGTAFPRTNWVWRQGERWAILGPDGSGKAVLVSALAGHAALASGEVRGPHRPDDASDLPLEDAIALVSPETQRQRVIRETTFYQSRWHSGIQEGQTQVRDFLSQQSVEEHNPYEVRPELVTQRRFPERRRRFVQWLGVGGLWLRRLAHLSNGEMRKVLLVWALLRSPRLLVLNDPYAGLDVGTRRRLASVVNRLMRGHATPVLVVTHRVEEVPVLATHLLLIHDHKILAQGLKSDMLRIWQARFERVTVHSSVIIDGAQPRHHSSQAQFEAKNALVELRDVTVAGGRKPILQRVTWTIRQGECWLMLGPNGAGKSTLLNLIQGDHPQAYAQNIRLFGRSTESTRDLWEARQQIGWMSPELHQHYPPEWPVLDVVLSGFFSTIGLYQTATRTQRAAARQWLQDLGLDGEARAIFGELSFGHQRLVLLARAVVKRPRLLILDEPCQGLDAPQRRTLLAAVDRLVAQARVSLIFVTHHRDERPDCITHVLRLAAGRVMRKSAVADAPKVRRMN